MALTHVEQRQYAEKLCRLANDRSRLLYGLEMTLQALGVPPKQVKRIVADVRAAEFGSLRKTLKIKD